jgi:rhodanese-related sulfurtransferase
MTTSVKEMLAAANAVVPRLEPAALQALLQAGNVLLVDVRDAPELAAGGKVKGAVHVPRGMLEFRADSQSPYYNPAFKKDATVVLYCASGGRAALAAKVLLDFGFQSVHTAGAFKDLASAGLPVETVAAPKA